MKYLVEFRKARDKIEGFLEVYENSVYYNNIDEFEWNNIFKASKRLQTIESEGSTVHKKYVTIMQDLFYSLYKMYVHFIEQDKLSSETALFNRGIMAQLVQMSRYEELRAYTVNNTLNTAVALVELSEELRKLVEEAVKKNDEMLEKLQEMLKSLEDSLKDLDENASDDDLTDEQKQQIEDLIKAAKEASASIVPDLGDLADTLDDIVSSARESDETQRTWGLHKNDSFTKLPYQQKLEAFEKLRSSSKMRDMADMLGHFKAMASNHQATRIKKDMSSLQKTKLSNEIHNAIPSEILKLCDDDMEMMFLQKAVSHSLETFEYEDDTEDIKGPIVICIDESGSMGGAREIWAKACALAVVHQAKLERRSVYVIHFSNVKNSESQHVNVFPKDKDLDVNEVVDMAEHFYNGGTCFKQPIEKLMKCIDSETDFIRADGLFITDGECRMDKSFLDNFKKWKKKNNVKLYGVHIGGWGGDGMTSFCNKVYPIQDLTDGLFSKINSHMMD